MSLIKINKDLVKRVFVLEDEEYRVKFFQEIFGDINYFITGKVDIAINTLHAMKFDLIFLDHDLNDVILTEQNNGFREGTGFDVAKILRDTINCETPCIIHSLNPVGSSNMVRIHPFNTYAIPFHLLKECFTDSRKKET